MNRNFLVTSIVALTLNSAMVSSNALIDPYAISPITKKDYPKLYAAWGAKGVKKINELMPKAAKKTAESSECDKVDMVSLSQNRSIPGKKIVLFVDCANSKRFYIDDSELMASSPIKSQEKKMSAITDSQATNLCELEIKKQLTNPLTFNRKFGTSSVYRAPGTGNIVVEFIFEAKNNFGAQLPNRARCVIDDRGLEAVITKG